ncbi:MAG: ComEA family DNA-binding protein [Actinobacteria bacterium]|nr:ComEA family DNA-binding protein [Actinomycetota bacterium]
MGDMELRLPPLSRRRLAAGAVLLAVGLVLLLRHLGSGGAAAAPRVAPVRASRAAVAARQLVVDVAGAVRRPGLYRLREGTRIADAVASAGGATAKAALDSVNLAAPLADGEQVVVPARGAAGTPADFPPAAGSSPAAPLDLNTATAEQLDALPGIGPSTAAKILAYRQTHGPFHSVDELDAVPGIGPSRIAQLKGLVIP